MSTARATTTAGVETVSIETKLGTFVLRQASEMDKFRIERLRKTRFGADMTPEDSMYLTGHAYATIEVVGVTLPVELNWDKIYDDRPFIEVWNKYNEWLASFRDAASPDAA